MGPHLLSEVRGARARLELVGDLNPLALTFPTSAVQLPPSMFRPAQSRTARIKQLSLACTKGICRASAGHQGTHNGIQWLSFWIEQVTPGGWRPFSAQEKRRWNFTSSFWNRMNKYVNLIGLTCMNKYANRMLTIMPLHLECSWDQARMIWLNRSTDTYRHYDLVVPKWIPNPTASSKLVAALPESSLERKCRDANDFIGQ